MIEYKTADELMCYDLTTLKRMLNDRISMSVMNYHPKRYESPNYEVTGLLVGQYYRTPRPSHKTQVKKVKEIPLIKEAIQKKKMMILVMGEEHARSDLEEFEKLHLQAGGSKIGSS